MSYQFLKDRSPEEIKKCNDYLTGALKANKGKWQRHMHPLWTAGKLVTGKMLEKLTD